jgi:tRNA A37 methylthiotransferase MiaB
MKACVISLGCPKNLCDSEVLMGKLDIEREVGMPVEFIYNGVAP